ncbi:MAG: DNA polymerase IV [Nitrososphaerales archaeon]
MPERVVMQVDLDYFYAQCEEVRNPALKNKPVVVCIYSGRGGDSGAVSTSNYVARRYGVRSGMPIVRAKQLLTSVEAVFLKADLDYYDEVSRRIMKMLRKYADRFEEVSVDEAYLDVTERTKGDYDTAKELATKIKTEIKEAENLTCSIGIGPNKVIAKIASDYQKPNGLTVVKPDEAFEFISKMKVDKLPGVGAKTKEILEGMGVKTIGELAKQDPQKLVSRFGKKLGNYLYNAANGRDDEPVKERLEPTQFSRIVTLKQDLQKVEEIEEYIDEICRDLYARVSSQGYSFKSVGVMCVSDALATYTRSETYEHPLDSYEALRSISTTLLSRLLGEEKIKTRRVGVKVSDLVKKSGQKTLYDFLTY